MKDNIFKEKITKQFEFDENVASVFDDMINRSVPFYNEVLDITTSFAIKYLEDGSIVYDLGCSTASTLINISQKSNLKLDLIGIDSSDAMLKRAIQKIDAYGLDIKLIQDDILNHKLRKSKVIISNYTLQFIRPLKREDMVKKIYDSLEEGGVFIFSEKVICEDKFLNKQFIDKYYEFKKSQGYSEFEISQKREALENILIPYSYEENKNMVHNIRFKYFDCLFKWANFATFIAIK